MNIESSKNQMVLAPCARISRPIFTEQWVAEELNLFVDAPGLFHDSGFTDRRTGARPSSVARVGVEPTHSKV